MPDQRAILRITNEEHSTNVVSGEISAHIESAGVSGRRDGFCVSKKFQFIAELRRAFQRTCQTARVDSVSALEFN